MRRAALRTALAVVLGVPLVACITSVGMWTYPSGRYPTTVCDRRSPAIVAVERFDDRRDETNKSWMALAYIPFSPLGWTHFDRPEATVLGVDTSQYRAEPCDDLARSVAAELEREQMVARAEYVSDGHVDASATHVLRGKLRTFNVHESRWTYGLSIDAWVLWYLGLPMGTSRNGFFVDLELADARDGRILWTGTLYDADFHVEGMYYGPEWYRFSWMWERRLREELGEVAKTLGVEAAALPDAMRAELAGSPAVLPICRGIDSASPCQEW